MPLLSARLFATLAFLGAIGLASLVILVPSVAADHPGIVALLCLILGAVLLRWCPRHAAARRFFWLLIPLAVLLVPMVTVARSFRRLDMVSLLFHAQMGVGDAGIQGLETEILQAVLATGFVLLGFWGLARLWGFGKVTVLAMALYLLAINPFVTALVVIAMAPGPKADLTKDLVMPARAAGLDQPVDLLMIYLEGTDRQFADPEVWGDAYAPLNQFAAEGVTFSRVGQIVGTGWSLAGVTASQCGVPILPRGLLYGMNFDKAVDFMPGISCLGDLLAAQDYYSAYVVGGPLAFGGLDLLFETHGYSEAIGREALTNQLPKAETDAALIGWVLDDQLVFDYATGLHEKMLGQTVLDQPRPYALVVETIGPHGKKAFMSRHCAEDGLAQFSTDFDRVLRCTINDTMAFVAEARARQAALRPGRPLLVVLQSDHLNHNAATPAVGAEFGGFNTVLMAGAGLPAGKIVTKPAGMIDVYPTILQAMGLARAPFAAGLGRSLLGLEPTLVERYGVEDLEPMVVMNPDLANRVWGLESPVARAGVLGD